MTNLHVIFGTGPLGLSVMRALLQKNHNVRMVNRSGKAIAPSVVETMKADVYTGEGLQHAVANATVVYQCVNPPYHRWRELFPQMQRNIINAAQRIGAVTVIGENLYMYGDTKGVPMKESMPYSALTNKGEVRAAMAKDALHIHMTGKAPIVIGRGSDFFGPGVTSSALGERQIGRAVSGKKGSWIGSIDVPHSFTYIDDFGHALVTLAEHPKSYGRAWHVPTPPAWSQRQIIEEVYQILGTSPSYSVMGKTMMRIGGWFIPEARETVEMMYEFDQPFIVDSSDFESAFHVAPASMKQALQETVRWYQQHPTV